MRLNFDVNAENYDKTAKKFKILGNLAHLKILLILEAGSMTMDAVHAKLKEHGIYKHRENTYKALEKLVELKILKKEYREEQRRFFYSLP